MVQVLGANENPKQLPRYTCARRDSVTEFTKRKTLIAVSGIEVPGHRPIARESFSRARVGSVRAQMENAVPTWPLRASRSADTRLYVVDHSPRAPSRLV